MFDEILRLILDLGNRKPTAAMPKRLDALFGQLAADPTNLQAFECEDMIWEAWTDHPDPRLAARMNEAIARIARKRYDEALALLDELIEADANWAEAWNKRATVHYLMGRDPESVADVRRVLELEPRHFGALSGFAQLCLRRGNPTAALIAFEAALRINPHLATIRIAVEELRRTCPPTLH